MTHFDDAHWLLGVSMFVSVVNWPLDVLVFLSVVNRPRTMKDAYASPFTNNDGVTQTYIMCSKILIYKIYKGLRENMVYLIKFCYNFLFSFVSGVLMLLQSSLAWVWTLLDSRILKIMIMQYHPVWHLHRHLSHDYLRLSHDHCLMDQHMSVEYECFHCVWSQQSHFHHWLVYDLRHALVIVAYM